MRVLNAILVREFYLANSGFFLLVVAIAGGFMRGYEHIALAEFFISTPMVLCIPLTVWILYALKVANFNGERLSLQENEFVFYFPLFPVITQWSLVLRAAALQLSPVFFVRSIPLSGSIEARNVDSSGTDCNGVRPATLANIVTSAL